MGERLHVEDKDRKEKQRSHRHLMILMYLWQDLFQQPIPHVKSL